MSFFGLKTVVQDSQNKQPTVYDFDDVTDDNLAGQLDETHDDLNDETFGASFSANDRNFDFAGQTAMLSGTPNYSDSQNIRGSSSGSSVPSLQPMASIWGSQEGQQQQQLAAAPAPAAPKVLSVEEVEAQMRSRQQQQQQQPSLPQMGRAPGPNGPFPGFTPDPYGLQLPQDPAILNRAPHLQQMPAPPMNGFPPQMAFPPVGMPPVMPPNGFPIPGSVPNVSGYPAPFPPGPHNQNQSQQQQQSQPTSSDSAKISETKHDENEKVEIPTPYTLKPKPTAPIIPLEQLRLEDANAHSRGQIRTSPQERPQERTHDRQQQFDRPHGDRHYERGPRQPLTGSAKCNGLMSQWDKNFIMRIQLQQMVTEDPYNEDFYYQVHSAIQSRNIPENQLDALARTYLFRGNNRNGRNRFKNDNPLKRMQQQVQQAVASAKDHPKTDTVVREGALGKIAVGSGKRPRKALNVSAASVLKQSLDQDDYNDNIIYSSNPKLILRGLEEVYTALLDIESSERSKPSDDQEDAFKEWDASREAKLENLWKKLQVLAPVDSEGNQPFILMLEHDKGKKLMPRVFRHIDSKQRLTLLTRIVAHLNQLDVIKNGGYSEDGKLSQKVKDTIELFSQTVLPPLVHLISESSYDIVIGLLDIILNNGNVVELTRKKIGLAFLTVLVSRAELINQEGEVGAQEIEVWQQTFNDLFTKVRGHLLDMFPPSDIDDSYVWHFLASLAVAARLEHQRVLVDEVRSKVFGTMAESKKLPPAISEAKIANLNLFLNVMGLNATQNEITELN